mgnify:CR=1 FL=1
MLFRSDGRGGYIVENLADQWRDRAMHPTIVHLAGIGNRHHPDNHDGERFLLVLDGEVKLEYGHDVIHLDAGDSVYIYAAIPHVLMPAGRSAARVLSVSYSPETASGRGAKRSGRQRPAAPPTKGKKPRAAPTDR